jgi:hypothetical protein
VTERKMVNMHLLEVHKATFKCDGKKSGRGIKAAEKEIESARRVRKVTEDEQYAFIRSVHGCVKATKSWCKKNRKQRKKGRKKGYTATKKGRKKGGKGEKRGERKMDNMHL